MVALRNVMTLGIDRAREAEDGHHTQHVVHTGPRRQTSLALREGVQRAEHEADLPETLYILRGAIRVHAEEPFVLQSGDLHEMPSRRRSVEAIQDTVMLLTAVPSPGATRSGDSVHVLAPE